MKLTDANVYLLEHKLIEDIDPITAADDKEARDLTMWIAGVNAMAQAVVEALRGGNE